MGPDFLHVWLLALNQTGLSENNAGPRAEPCGTPLDSPLLEPQVLRAEPADGHSYLF